MLNFFIYFIDFLKRKCYKNQNNRKFKQKIGVWSIKIFTTLIFNKSVKTKIDFFILGILVNMLKKEKKRNSEGNGWVLNLNLIFLFKLRIFFFFSKPPVYGAGASSSMDTVTNDDFLKDLKRNNQPKRQIRNLIKFLKRFMDVNFFI